MSKKDPKSISVLSIDGGGILGLYSANVLKHIQEDLLGGEPFSEYFDLVTGTSTGGIIALGLASGHAAEEIVDFYQKYGGEIFPHSPWIVNKIRTLISNKYSNEKLASCLDAFFDGEKVSGCAMKFCVPAIDVTEGKAIVFKTNNNGMQTRDENYLLRDIALATSAAPTYLPLHSLDDVFSMLADGGLWQNNPSLIGLIEANASMQANAVNVLSIGNPLSNIKECVANKKMKNGLMTWGSKIVTMPMKVASIATNEIMEILHRTQSMNLHKYLRVVHSDLADENKDLSLDNASPSALKRLIALSDKDYQKSKPNLLNFFREEK